MPRPNTCSLTPAAGWLSALALAACSTSPAPASPPAVPLDAPAADLGTDAPAPEATSGDGAPADVARDEGADASFDARADAVEEAAGCPAGETLCGDRCVRTSDDPAHCGGCGRACVAPANGASTCAAGACAVRCDPGFVRVGDACARPRPPRPIAPLSLGTISNYSVPLRWELSPGLEGVEVEACRDRACTMLLRRFDATDTSASLGALLSGRGAVYWRLRGRAGGAVVTDYGPTWLFHLPRLTTALTAFSADARLDVNGDGFDDLVVGVGSDRGAVQVYLGGSTGLPATPSQTLQGVAAEDGFGSEVASAGDVNGDGYGDLLVGAPGADPMGVSNAGAVSLFLGGPSGLAMTPAAVVPGTEANQYLGTALAAAGDVDLDGYGDVLIGSSASSPGGRTRAGVAWLYRGAASGIGPTPARTFEGGAAGDGLGIVSGAGDLNGDTFADIAIGAPGADPGGRAEAGVVTVYFGGATGPAAVPSVTLEGQGVTDAFGASLAPAGDADVDGYSDLLIGAPGATVEGARTAGAVVLAHGAGDVGALTRRVVFRQTNGFWRFGQVVSGADFNGDGRREVVVASRNAQPTGATEVGRLWIFNGVLGGVSPTVSRVIDGAAAREQLGASIAARHDHNGDGFTDLAVGAYGVAPGGRVQVFYGGGAGVGGAASLTLTGAAGATLGGAIAR